MIADLNDKMMSFQRKKKLFHDAPITPFKMFLQGNLLLLIARNPEMIVRCVSSSDVFRSVTATTENTIGL